MFSRLVLFLNAWVRIILHYTYTSSSVGRGSRTNSSRVHGTNLMDNIRLLFESQSKCYSEILKFYHLWKTFIPRSYKHISNRRKYYKTYFIADFDPHTHTHTRAVRSCVVANSKWYYSTIKNPRECLFISESIRGKLKAKL